MSKFHTASSRNPIGRGPHRSAWLSADGRFSSHASLTVSLPPICLAQPVGWPISEASSAARRLVGVAARASGSPNSATSPACITSTLS